MNKIKGSYRLAIKSPPKLPICDIKAKPYKGPPFQELSKIRSTRLSPGYSSDFLNPLALHQGHKQWLFDINGKRYLDMFGGICTVSVGHCHPKIVDTINKQSSRLGHASNIYYHEKIHEYAIKLTDKFPGSLKVVYFVNSGSEANDLAMLLVRTYTKNNEIIALRNCYHGMTYQTMSLTSHKIHKFPVAQIGGVSHIMHPDVYRGLWGGANCRDSPVQTSRTCDCNSANCNAENKYIDQLNDSFKYVLKSGQLAAFFAEPIQGVGGIVQYPRGYIKKAYEIVKQNGGLFVSDEVQTGFGRTGEHFWGFEMHGIVPDIVTMAKGIGNGFPLAAVVTTPEIAQAFTKATHFNTFGGNPFACAIGISVLDVIEEEKLQQNCLDVGTYLLKELEKLRDKFSIIGVRGKGLMVGVELVSSDEKAPLENKKFLQIWTECRDLGLIIGRGGSSENVFRILPPMCISREDADFTIQVLDYLFSKYEYKHNK